jgi:hypothetical protein
MIGFYVFIGYHEEGQTLGKSAPEDCIIPTITPNSPSAEPKISITRILTKVSGVYASAIAQPDPVIPTAILNYINHNYYPQTRLLIPTDIPVQNIEYPANNSIL